MRASTIFAIICLAFGVAPSFAHDSGQGPTAITNLIWEEQTARYTDNDGSLQLTVRRTGSPKPNFPAQQQRKMTTEEFFAKHGVNPRYTKKP
ncbi:hypothetical protein F5148DRAFT_1245450 [Russula earlei]|uniref:Uncharacterized protein n=1 Tax=Russula earlei TaxID=71964 RepID=A0ACC0TV94_9AGAM|nr:hypothetical protein F5148DRAFT_1245450 [Russula earlei]